MIRTCHRKPHGTREVYDNVLFVCGELYDLDDGFLRESLRGSEKVTHLWYFKVRTCVYQRLLSKEELEKATGFMFQGDMQRFVFSRGMLRVLLGYYLNKESENILVETNKNGKTVLTEATRLGFSLAHTGDVVAYAFTNVGDVGVDVEGIREVANMEVIAKKLFSDRALKIFLEMSISDRKRLFFRAWTAREACFKAYGGCIDDFQVDCEEDLGLVHVTRNNVRLSGRIHQLIIDDYCFSVISS